MNPKLAYKKTYQHFYERQRYKNIALIIIFIVAEIVLSYYILDEVLTDNLWGSKKNIGWLIIIGTILIPTPILLGMILIRLDTIITEEGIFYRWFPFQKNYQMILWENVQEVFVVDMKNVGFIWRFRNKYDETNFPGSEFALLIQLKSGRKKLIGTRKAEEMNRVLIRNSGNRYHSTFVEKIDYE